MHFMLREWLVGCLTALTNYSMYAIQDGTHLSGPIHFTSLIRPISFFLFCLCADEFVGSGSGRIEWQHCFLSSYIDCHIARARRTRYPARQRARVQRVKYAKHTHDAPTCLPLQFYRKSTPQPVVAITTRSYKHGQIVRRLTAVGSAVSLPVAASFQLIQHSPKNWNSNVVRCHNHIARHGLRSPCLDHIRPLL
ncbi:hypothetical protein BGY98DRAFT_1008830, partial [Russula aff. rugulosa BPL654]